MALLRSLWVSSTFPGVVRSVCSLDELWAIGELSKSSGTTSIGVVSGWMFTGRNFHDHTAPCLRQELTRWTVILHLRKMFGAFARTETQNERSIRNPINCLRCGKEELSARCKARTLPRAVWSLQREGFNSTRNEEKLSVDYGQRSRRRFFWNFQSAIGWKEEYCYYLDSLMSIDFSQTATWQERERYEKQ